MEEEKIVQSENGEINNFILSEDAIMHIKMFDESILYVKFKNQLKKATSKQIWISDLIKNYKGPSVYLDFNEDEELIGLEIIE